MSNNLSVRIRKAKVADLNTLQILSSELIESNKRFDKYVKKEWSFSEEGKKYLLRKIRGKKGACFVAEINGAIVGYFTCGLIKTQKWRPFKRAELDNIFVKEAYRRQKIGSALMNTFLTWCKERKVERALLYTRAENSEAIKFYQDKLYNKFQLILERKI